MKQEHEIPSDEIILRRIPPAAPDKPIMMVPIRSGGWRASSVAIKPKMDQAGPSFTRLSLTSPRQLLDLLALQDICSEGWFVCRLKVSKVRAIDWEVIPVHHPKDPGHCEIRPTTGTPFKNTLWSRLARQTRVLSCDEVKSLKAGDHLAG